MHQYIGKIKGHTGSMFSGKTSGLQSDVKRFEIAGYKVLTFKPSIDKRYSKNQVVSHDNKQLDAIRIDDINDLIDSCARLNPKVIAIDEVQFLKGDIDYIIKAFNNLLLHDCTIIWAGLDMDSQGNPFPVTRELMPITEYLSKHHAICKKCGSDAWISHKLTDSKTVIEIGAENIYAPLCRKCYYEIKGE